MTKVEARQIRDAVEDAELPTDARYEIIDGQVVETSGMGPSGCVIASTLASRLGMFIQRRMLGRLVFETLFRIDPTTYRRPNLAFVSFER
jgi:Putative restriction endonuclease